MSRRQTITLGFAVLLLAIAGIEIFARHKEKLAQMSAIDAWVALAATPEAAVTEFARGGSPQLYYSVVLQNAPLGLPLDLRCEWVDPSGRVARHNVYRTRFIYKSTWPTHCQQRLDPSVAVGAWEVRLLEGDRVLRTSPFAVR